MSGPKLSLDRSIPCKEAFLRSTRSAAGWTACCGGRRPRSGSSTAAGWAPGARGVAGEIGRDRKGRLAGSRRSASEEKQPVDLQSLLWTIGTVGGARKASKWCQADPAERHEDAALVRKSQNIATRCGCNPCSERHKRRRRCGGGLRRGPLQEPMLLFCKTGNVAMAATLLYTP